MKILVTGINSALGRAVSASLRSHEVIGLSRRPHPYYPTILCDLRRGVPALPHFDICLHMAFATNPIYCREHHEEAYQVNVTSTRRLLPCASRFVFISTGYVYGFKQELLTEEVDPDPVDEYSRMKLEAEAEVFQHNNAVALRYFFPYGPATKPENVINRLMRNIALGTNLHEGGGPRTNPIFLSNLVEATRTFCFNGHTGAYNVGGPEVVSIKRLAERIGSLLGKQPCYRPTGKHTEDMVGSIAKLADVYRPAIRMREGLAATVTHFLSQSNAAPLSPGGLPGQGASRPA